MNSKLEWSSAFQKITSNKKCINGCLVLILEFYSVKHIWIGGHNRSWLKAKYTWGYRMAMWWWMSGFVKELVTLFWDLGNLLHKMKRSQLKCLHHVLQRSTIAPSKSINMFPVHGKKKLWLKRIHKLGHFFWHVNQHETRPIEVD